MFSHRVAVCQRAARSWAAPILIVLIGLRQAAGDDAASAPIATDRPAVTDSSVVVPAGSLQFENGFAYTVSQGQQTLDGPETLLRFGAASKTELRLDVPDYFGPVGSGLETASGFGDLGIGVKQQLGPSLGFDVSLVLTLSLPTGARGISSHGYDPSAQLPWSRALSSNWTAAGMLSVYWPTEDGRRNVTGETTFLIDRQLTKPWDAFVEYVGDFPEQGGPRHLIHFGTAYKPTPHQQLDLHVGVGLSSAAVDHFVGVGYSFRFQAVRR
jgi:Putative MetA-pathway of phenol degradation